MNLFRSEEPTRRRSGFRAEAAAGLLSLDALDIMSVPSFRERLNGRYVSSVPIYRPAFLERLKAASRGDPFWDPTPR